MEYTFVDIKTRISKGKVVSKHHSKGCNRGVFCYKLETGQQFRLSGITLHKEEYIHKKANFDTIIIIHCNGIEEISILENRDYSSL